MATPKKSVKKGPIERAEDKEMTDGISLAPKGNKNSFDDDDDEFDLPLDDLDGFDEFGTDDDDDNY